MRNKLHLSNKASRIQVRERTKLTIWRWHRKQHSTTVECCCFIYNCSRKHCYKRSWEQVVVVTIIVVRMKLEWRESESLISRFMSRLCAAATWEIYQVTSRTLAANKDLTMALDSKWLASQMSRRFLSLSGITGFSLVFLRKLTARGKARREEQFGVVWQFIVAKFGLQHVRE